MTWQQAISSSSAKIQKTQDEGTPIKDLLNRALQSSKATEADKKAALFNLAILDEKFQQWNMAEDHWNQYLKIDPAGPWADEARARLEEVKNHLKRSKIEVRIDPLFYLSHLSEPAVQDYTEEYLEKATSWLLEALISPAVLRAGRWRRWQMS